MSEKAGCFLVFPKHMRSTAVYGYGYEEEGHPDRVVFDRYTLLQIEENGVCSIDLGLAGAYDLRFILRNQTKDKYKEAISPIREIIDPASVPRSGKVNVGERSFNYADCHEVTYFGVNDNMTIKTTINKLLGSWEDGETLKEYLQRASKGTGMTEAKFINSILGT